MLHLTEFGNLARVLLNRPHAGVDASALWSRYGQDGAAVASRLRALASPPKLLTVITTYARPEACLELLQSLGKVHDFVRDSFVLVVNDHSASDYQLARAYAERTFGARLLWLDARERLGKPGFWIAYQVAFWVAQCLQPDHALFLQDDLTFDGSLLEQVGARWRATESDPRRRVLYLFSSDADEWLGRWTLYPRRSVGHGLRRTQWFDLQAFFVDRAFFELLRYQMIPVHPNRWRRAPRISSGVGKQLTLRLLGRANIYQAYPPLVFHGDYESQMNPQARARRALDNRELAAASRVDTSPSGSRRD
jgi:hypothetical protein